MVLYVSILESLITGFNRTVVNLIDNTVKIDIYYLYESKNYGIIRDDLQPGELQCAEPGL